MDRRMPVFEANFLMVGISDHCPLKIAREGSPNRSKTAFKYCNVWAKHPKFLDINQQGWQVQHEACKMF
ncbi:hypothetical protein RDI58_017351 [Solanum bulbocastanum]|uniref:Uncharacterized protein n=1 Tax=Solanum bulbocastanum TaxID=147425 RepID=A0AAN8Y939_SOLBU